MLKGVFLETNDSIMFETFAGFCINDSKVNLLLRIDFETFRAEVIYKGEMIGKTIRKSPISSFFKFNLKLFFLNNIMKKKQKAIIIKGIIGYPTKKLNVRNRK